MEDKLHSSVDDDVLSTYFGEEIWNFKTERIKITIGGIPVVAELKPNRTAHAVLEVLPITAPVNQWGEEFYCRLEGVKDYRETATNQVKVGDVAFWGMGGMLAVFFWTDSHESRVMILSLLTG